MIFLGIGITIASVVITVFAIMDKSDEAMSVVPFTTILSAVGILIALNIF